MKRGRPAAYIAFMAATRPPLPGGRYRPGLYDDGDLRMPERRSYGPLGIIKRLALGAIVAIAVLILGAGTVLGVAMYRYAHPARTVSQESPAGLFLAFEEATIPASDGVSLGGWWIQGRADAPALILAHDRSGSRADLLGLAAKLSEPKYSVLLIDFRGHGSSQGTSSFGVLEKRDLLGAVDWVCARPHVDRTRLGIVGIGMGAHAAILAAAERPQVRCLALDTPYPDAPSRFLAAGMPDGVLKRWLTSGSDFLYDIVYRVRSRDETAASAIRQLSDRNLLLLAPKGVEPGAGDATAMYESVSEARNNFKNLVMLDATRTTALYGESRTRYDSEIVGFFQSYLPATPSEAPKTAKSPAGHS